MEKYDIENLEKIIKRLRNQNKLNEALSLCTVDNINILFQKAKLLYLIGCRDKDIEKLDEAINLYSLYPNDVRFSERLEKAKDAKRQIVNTYYLTKLLGSDLKLSEIEDKNIIDFDREILTIAYYDKYSRKNGLNLIKSLKNKYREDSDKLNTLKVLFNRLSGKKVIFDASFYKKYLGCNIDFDYYQELVKREKKEEKVVLEKNEKPVLKKENVKFEKKEKPKRAYIVSVGNKVNNRYNQVNNSNIINTNNYTVKLRIKDIFEEEVLSIQKYLYIMMNTPDKSLKATLAWDKFECLIEKDSTDKKALKSMVDLLKRIHDKSDLIIEDYNYVKYEKILSKNN